MTRKQSKNPRNTNTEAEKIKAANAGRPASENVNENISPSRGEVRGTPGVSSAATGRGATSSGLKPKLGRTGSDLDGQVTNE